MSFFSEDKNAGMAIIIVGILEIIGALIMIVCGLLKTEVGDNEFSIYHVVAGIGYLIAGIILLGYGKKVRGGAFSNKLDLLAEFVRIGGLIIIIGGIFSAAGLVADRSTGLGDGIISAIVAIIIGLIVIWISTKINDGKQTTGDKIIWILLLIIFVISAIMAILEIITIIGIITGICDLIISIFMITVLLGDDVKKGMGM